MKRIFKKLYEGYLNRKYAKKINEVNTLKYGDEIYCFIDDNKELMKIENDQIANFLFLSYKAPYIYCLYKTTSKKKYYHCLNEKSYIDSNKVHQIHIKNFICIKNSQNSPKDLDNLSKKIKFNDSSIKNIVTQKASITVGDIITKDNKKYFISDIIDGGVIAYQIYFNKCNNYIYLINNMYIDKNEPSYFVRDFAFDFELNLFNLEYIINELKQENHVEKENIKTSKSLNKVNYKNELVSTHYIKTNSKQILVNNIIINNLKYKYIQEISP